MCSAQGVPLCDGGSGSATTVGRTKRGRGGRGGTVHPYVRHDIVSPVPVMLQLDAGHTHRRDARRSSHPRNALLMIIWAGACLAGLRSRWPRLSMLTHPPASAACAVCSRWPLPHNKAATSFPPCHLLQQDRPLFSARIYC